MEGRRRPRTIGDVSVTSLLDDFVDPDVEDESKRQHEMDDDEYISMMLKKDAQRQLDRVEREAEQTEMDEETATDEDLEEIFESCQSCCHCVTAVSFIPQDGGGRGWCENL